MRPLIGLLRRLDDLPLRSAIAGALVLGLVLPIALSIWRGLAEWKMALLDHLQADHARMSEVLAIAMTTPVWEVRPDTGRPLLDAMMRDERVVAVAVSAPQMPDFLLSEAPERRTGEVLVRETDIVRAGETIGRVRVEMTTAPVVAEVAGQSRQVLLTGALQLALGLLLLFPLLRRKVLRPVARLVEHSRALARGDLDREYRWRRRDELGELGQSFEDTRRALARLIGDLEAANAGLRRRETELSRQTLLSRAILDNMTDGISLVDADLRLRAWNDRFLEILDLPAEVVVEGRPITDLHLYHAERKHYPDSTAAGFVERMRESLVPGQSWEAQIETSSGRTISIRRRPLDDGGFVTTYTDVSEQVVAQRKAADTLSLLEAVMDAVPAILHVKDRDLRYRMVNRYFLSLWGFRREEVIGRTVHEAFEPKWLEPFTDRGPEVLASGRPLPFYEIRVGLPDGEVLDFFGTKVPLTDASGAVTHVVTVEIDITQRKQAERALRESEELYRLLVDLAPFGIMLHDRTRIRFLNPAGCQILGVAGQEPLLGMHYIDFVADAEKAAAFDRVQRLFDLGEPLPPAERRLVTIDGVPIEAAVAAVPVRSNGRLLAQVVFQDITERKRAERALQESEEFHRRLVDLAPYGILLHDAERITYCNPAGRALLAAGAADAIEGRHYREFVHPDERAAALARLERVCNRGEPVPLVERRLRRCDGETIDVSIVGVPLRRGDETLAFVMFNDITERKRAEQERQLWLRRFHDAVESLPHGFAIFDAQRRLVTCNTAFADLYGDDRAALAGLPALELLRRFAALAVSVDDDPVEALAADLPSTFERVWFDDSAPSQVELRNGRWMLVAHHRTAEGGLVIVRTDVTELKRMQQALADSEELYRLLVDLSPYGILLHDANAIVFMNAAGRSILGADTLEHVAGRHFASFIAADEQGGASQRLAAVLAQGEAAGETEHRLQALDGREVTVASSAVPFNREGERLALVFFVDISRRKRAEAEIARQREALHQAEKMSALGSLLAGVAHELNNPLSVVVGRAIMLEDVPLEPKVAASVGKIRAAAERCAKIVRTFLAMARQQAPQRVPVRACELVEQALDLLSYGLKSSGIETVCDVPADLPPTLADPDQLTQVCNNLIINAKQAMAESPPPRRLTIIARHDPAGETLAIEFADTGPGIPADIRARVFDPFFTTKPAGSGTGIGLAVCRGIVEAHGGVIRLLGAEDGGPPVGGACGARFVVELPAMPADATQATTAAGG